MLRKKHAISIFDSRDLVQFEIVQKVHAEHATEPFLDDHSYEVYQHVILTDGMNGLFGKYSVFDTSKQKH